MIGKKILEIRKRRGLTLTEVAERAGIAKSYLSNIERNSNTNPSINVIEKIAKVLDVEMRELLNTDSPKKPKQQMLEEDWVEFVKELKEIEIEKEQVEEYKTLLEFIKWRNKQG